MTVIVPLGLGLPPVGGPHGELSHLDAHWRAYPPAELLQPLGEETPEAICKGYDAEREMTLTSALLKAELHSRLIRVAVASNGTMTAGLVKLQAGDKQSQLIWIADLEADAVRVVQLAFTALPDLDHLDLWAVLPGEREFESVHRPVFSLSVSRDQLADLLNSEVAPAALLSCCGCIRLDPLLLQYAIDGVTGLEVHTIAGEVLAQETLADRWVQFGAQARTSGELEAIPQNGSVAGIVEGDRAGNVVALTIDDGPEPLTTPLTLDVLRRAGVKVTFFVVGEKVEQYPELARMIVREGHEIGNHTYSHIPLSNLNPRGVWSQLRGCDVALRQACGVQPYLARPPGGDFTEATLRLMNSLGYVVTLWTANAGDWVPSQPDKIVANALVDLHPGSIILMHQGDLWSLNALPKVIAGIHQAGLRVGTVTEALGNRPITYHDPRKLVAIGQRSHIDSE
ncbi:MAG: polysaccharide deacetylase family protein [Candidatus Zipacnadales bacterium]